MQATLREEASSASEGSEDRERFAALRSSARGCWDADADHLLLETLASIRDRFQRRYTKLTGDVASLELDAQSASTELQNVLTSLLLLSHQQFVQNRVAGEEEDAAISGRIHSRTLRSATRTRRVASVAPFMNGGELHSSGSVAREMAAVVGLCDAIQSYRIVPLPDEAFPVGCDGADDDEEDEESGDGGFTRRRRGPYHEGRLMARIGSPAFMADPYGGYYTGPDGRVRVPEELASSEEGAGEGGTHPRAAGAGVGLTATVPAHIRSVHADAARAIPPPSSPAPSLPPRQGDPNHLPEGRPTPVSRPRAGPPTTPALAQDGGGAPVAALSGGPAAAVVPPPPPPAVRGAGEGRVVPPSATQAKAPAGPTLAPGKGGGVPHAPPEPDTGKTAKPALRKAPLKKRPLARRVGRSIFESSSSGSGGDEEAARASSSSSSSSTSSSSSSSSLSSTTSSSSSDSTVAGAGPAAPPAAASATAAVTAALPTSQLGPSEAKGAKDRAPNPVAASTPPLTPVLAPSGKGEREPVTVGQVGIQPPRLPQQASEPAATATPAEQLRSRPPSPPLPLQAANGTGGTEDDTDDDDFLPPPPMVVFPTSDAVAPSAAPAPEAPARAGGRPSLPPPPPLPLSAASPALDEARRREESKGSDLLPPPPPVRLPGKGQKVLSTSSDSDEEA